jgi:cytochrome c peroxidase
MFNQQIHGSKRSLRSVEDFTEFEQRTPTSTATR